MINLNKTHKRIAIILFLPFFVLMAHSAFAPADAVDQKAKITIDFHSPVSLGSLYVVPIIHGVPYATWRERQMIGAAVGKVSVTVPPDHQLCFEPNRRLLDHPELMNKFDPDFLDILYISASSMDDTENQRCNQALAYASHFKSLKEIVADRSDVTDIGLMKLINLESLQAISTMHCDVNGSCLQSLSKLPKLHALDLWGTHIAEANFKYLPSLKVLDYLNLNQTRLTAVEAREIGKCISLKQLFLAYDVSVNNSMVSSFLPLKNLEKLDLRQTSIDDKCLPTLARMKSLKDLDLRGTAVTPAGLVALIPLHLVALRLSNHAYSDLQIKQIHSVCAGTVTLPGVPKAVDKDTMRTFAPLSRHVGL